VFFVAAFGASKAALAAPRAVSAVVAIAHALLLETSGAALGAISAVVAALQALLEAHWAVAVAVAVVTHRFLETSYLLRLAPRSLAVITIDVHTVLLNTLGLFLYGLEFFWIQNFLVIGMVRFLVMILFGLLLHLFLDDVTDLIVSFATALAAPVLAFVVTISSILFGLPGFPLIEPSRIDKGNRAPRRHQPKGTGHKGHVGVSPRKVLVHGHGRKEIPEGRSQRDDVRGVHSRLGLHAAPNELVQDYGRHRQDQAAPPHPRNDER